MPALIPWPVSDLCYDGCCTHFSTKEGVVSAAMNLTPEEIEALDANRLEVKRPYDREWKAALGPGVHAARSKETKEKALKDQRHKFTICDLTFRSNAWLLGHQNLHIHIRKAAGIVKTPKGRGGSQLAITRKKHWCETCKHAAASAARLETHLKGPRHAKKLRDLAASSKLA